MHFLFPADPLEPTVVDELFRDQCQELRSAGFTSSLLRGEPPFSATSLREIPNGCEVVYRGWMLKPSEYSNLVALIERNGAKCLTSANDYVAAHYLPSWYPALTDLTPETIAYAADVDIVSALRELNWTSFFIKDFVKSLKTSPGPIVHNAEDAPGLVAAMLDYRGEIEGGLCVRRVESFEPGSETRYFVLHSSAYSPSESKPPPPIVMECARRISLPFFSVDVACRTDGIQRIIEIGDGQVSDLVGWTVEAFVAMWRQATT